MKEKIKLACIIDDDKIYVNLVKKIIETKKLCDHLLIFKDGKEGIDYFETLLQNFEKENLPEVILLDLNMPVMDGWEFLDYCEKHIPTLTDSCMICILSSSIIGKDIIRADQHPMVSEYVAKPLTGAKVKSAYQLYFNLIGVKQKSK